MNFGTFSKSLLLMGMGIVAKYLGKSVTKCKRYSVLNFSLKKKNYPALAMNLGTFTYGYGYCCKIPG